MIQWPFRLVAAVALLSSTGVISDPVSDGQWFSTFLRLEEAHTHTKGAGASVAVLDTGIDGHHSDLRGSLGPGIDLIDDGDGQVDTNGHGTAMAGLVAAHGRAHGIAPDAAVLPVRISQTTEGTTDHLAQGVRWATAHDAQVISISLAIPDDDILVRQAIENAIAHDIVVVAAAGNRPEANSVQWPAAIPGVIAVAGVDRNGNHSKVSVSGPEVVLAAPSDDISSTNTGGGYRVGTGTSDATAIVAGVVALVRSRFPQLKAAEVVRRLEATAIDKGPPGRDSDYGYGIVNPVGALTAALPAETQAPPTQASATPSPQTQKRFSWWLIALPATAGVAAIAFGSWRWRRTTRSQTGTHNT